MKTDTKGQTGEAATPPVGRTGSAMLDLEYEVMQTAAVLDLIGQRLVHDIEANSGRLDDDRTAGIITLITRTQDGLRSTYNQAHAEWAALRNGPRNN